MIPYAGLTTGDLNRQGSGTIHWFCSYCNQLSLPSTPSRTRVENIAYFDHPACRDRAVQRHPDESVSGGGEDAVDSGSIDN
jgi:hypothetical protein